MNTFDERHQISNPSERSYISMFEQKLAEEEKAELERLIAHTLKDKKPPLNEKAKSLYTDLLWLMIEKNAEEFKNKKKMKENFNKIIKPIVDLELNWIFMLENTVFTNTNYNNIADTFLHNKHPASQTPAHTVRYLIDAIDELQKNIPIDLLEGILDCIFYDLVTNLADFNIPTDDVMYKLTLIYNDFDKFHLQLEQKLDLLEARKKTINGDLFSRKIVKDRILHGLGTEIQALNLTKATIVRVKEIFEKKFLAFAYALRTRPHEIIQSKINKTFGEFLALLNELNEKDPPYQPSISALASYISNAYMTAHLHKAPVDLSILPELFNAYTAQVMLELQKGECSIPLYKLKEFETNILQIALLSGYDLEKANSMKDCNQWVQASFVTLEMRLQDAQSRMSKLIGMNYVADKLEAFKENVTQGLLSDEQSQYQAAINLLYQISYRHFDQDTRYKFQKETRKDVHGKIVTTGNTSELRNENVNDICSLALIINTASKHGFNPNAEVQDLATFTQKFSQDLRQRLSDQVATDRELINGHVAERASTHLKKLTEQKARVERVIDNIEKLGKELWLNSSIDKGKILKALAASLRTKTQQYYRTTVFDPVKNNKFKNSLQTLVTNTFNDSRIAKHHRQWAKDIQREVVNALLFAISIPKLVVTGSWLGNNNTRTQNKLLQFNKDFEKAFALK